jgi:hypothetical protein
LPDTDCFTENGDVDTTQTALPCMEAMEAWCH